MRYLLLALLFNFYTTANSQEVEFDSVYNYVFENAFAYAEVDNTAEALKVHFTSSKYLKLSYPVNGLEEFILIDNEQKFGGIFRKDSLELKRYADMPDKTNESLSVDLTKIGEDIYKGYDCNIYEITLGPGSLELYFEKEPSVNFNSFITNFLSSRGIKIDESTIPLGKLVFIKDIKTNGEAFTMELKESLDNQQIKFTLKTGA